MRTIVTGASGFVGRALCTALSAAGCDPVALDLRAAGERLAFRDARAVVHLAGIAHRRGLRHGELQRVNVGLAQRVGRAAAEAGAQLVFLSSVKVHGEESAAPLAEDAPIAPQDAYAQSKAAAEEALRAIPGLRLVVLRAPLVYGPAVKANFLVLLRAVALGLPLPLAGIANRRSFLYVGNLADAILRCLVTQAAGRNYLVCDGVSLSTPELCRKLGEALGRPARLFACPPALLELVPDARRLTRSLEVDDSALRAQLGWRAPFSLEEALRATADWYRRR